MQDPSIVTPEQHRKFQDDGFIVLKSPDVGHFRARLEEDLRLLSLDILRRFGVDGMVIESLEADSYAALMRWCLANEPDRLYTRTFYELYEASLELISAINDPLIVQLARELGIERPVPGTLPTIRIDRPGDQRFLTSLHQDYWYSLLSPNSITFWMAVIPLTPEMGYLQCLPESHRNGLVPFFKRDGDYTFTADVEVADQDYIEANLAEDEILIFNQYLLHRSASNTGDVPRVTLQLRYNDLNTLESMQPSFTATTSSYVATRQKELLAGFEDVTDKGTR